MTEGTALTQFFLQIWRLFQLESPFFGLSFADIAVGLFVCELGIGIFSSFFVGLFDTSAPSFENKADEYIKRRSRADRLYYYRAQKRDIVRGK